MSHTSYRTSSHTLVLIYSVTSGACLHAGTIEHGQPQRFQQCCGPHTPMPAQQSATGQRAIWTCMHSHTHTPDPHQTHTRRTHTSAQRSMQDFTVGLFVVHGCTRACICVHVRVCVCMCVSVCRSVVEMENTGATHPSSARRIVPFWTVPYNNRVIPWTSELGTALVRYGLSCFLSPLKTVAGFTFECRKTPRFLNRARESSLGQARVLPRHTFPSIFLLLRFSSCGLLAH